MEEWIKTDTMPDFDGDYLCHIVKKEECGNFRKYMKVVQCNLNVWVGLFDGERVTHWTKLPKPPERTLKLLNSNEPGAVSSHEEEKEV